MGCGVSYLKGYINVDAHGVLVKDDPEKKERNETTVKSYYKFPFGLHKPDGNETVCDLKCDVKDLPFEDNSIDEILTVNLVEHWPLRGFIEAVKEWHRVLKPGGTLIIDTPDVIRTANLLKTAKNYREFDLYLGWIYCHSRSEWDLHGWGYTSKYLNYLLEPLGYKFVKRDDDYIKHDAGYPHFINFYTK